MQKTLFGPKRQPDKLIREFFTEMVFPGLFS